MTTEKTKAQKAHDRQEAEGLTNLRILIPKDKVPFYKNMADRDRGIHRLARLERDASAHEDKRASHSYGGTDDE